MPKFDSISSCSPLYIQLPHSKNACGISKSKVQQTDGETDEVIPMLCFVSLAPQNGDKYTCR